jgi:translation initiation factor 5B
MSKTLRNLICTVVGHVDHGKTTILDHLRGSSIASQEAGLITQNISCCELPLKNMQDICKTIPEFKTIKLPGLLFIDTPGHMAFNNLRKRGGSLADIAILVIDINEGIKDQTLESIEILKKNKTPFIIAANKLDLIQNYQNKNPSVLKDIESQSEETKKKINNKIYEIVGKLSEHNINSDIFNKIDDFTKSIAIVPLSAKEEIGLAELLLVLCGLAQKFLEKNLNIDVSKPGKATILEIKEEKGIGLVLDTILYDGNIKKGDTIIIAGVEEPIVTKVKNIFKVENKLKPINKAEAASYIKLIAPNTEEVIAGMPLIVSKDIEQDKIFIQKEIKEVLIETDKAGVIVKANSIGSLEALTGLLKENKVKIKKASIGNITKKDIAAASSEEKKLYRVILGFNVKSPKDSKEVKIISKDIIYKIVENYKSWEEGENKSIETKALENLSRPFTVKLLTGCIFRQSNPAVVGVEVLSGNLKVDSKIMNEAGKSLGEVKTVQLDGENIKEAKKSQQIAIALPSVTVGRNLFENEMILSDFSEEEYRKLKEMKEFLNKEEKEILNLVSKIKRKEDKLWGV